MQCNSGLCYAVQCFQYSAAGAELQSQSRDVISHLNGAINNLPLKDIGLQVTKSTFHRFNPRFYMFIWKNLFDKEQLWSIEKKSVQCPSEAPLK